MKKTLIKAVKFLAVGLFVGFIAFEVYAVAGGDTLLVQRDPTNSFNATWFLPQPTGDSFYLYNNTTQHPDTALLGTGLVFSGGSITPSGVPQSAITGLVAALSGKQSTITIGSSSQYFKGDLTLGTLPSSPTVGIAYEGTTQRTGAFPIFKSATVSSGTAVFNLTNDGLSTGTSLCTNGVIQDSVNAFVSDATASYQMAYAFSNSNKTVTVTTNKLTTANILTGILGQAAGNGSAVKLSVWCY